MTQERDDRRAERGYLRDQVLETAGEVGMTRALADLGEPRALAARYAEEHGRRGPRGARQAVRVVAIVAALGLAVAAVVGARALPRIEATGTMWTDAAFVLTADPTSVRYVATDVGDGSRSVAVVVRNPRPFPVTLTGGDSLAASVRLTAAAPHGGIDHSTVTAERLRTLTVAPGDLALVWVAVSFPPCARYSAGNGIGVDAADVRVSALGVSRMIAIPLGASYDLVTTTDRVPPTPCTSDEDR